MRTGSGWEVDDAGTYMFKCRQSSLMSCKVKTPGFCGQTGPNSVALNVMFHDAFGTGGCNVT